MEWFQQRKAVQEMLLYIGSVQKKAEKEKALRRREIEIYEKDRRGKRILHVYIRAANKNAARYAKDYSATTRRAAKTAAKTPTANITIYTVYVKPPAAITGYLTFDREAGPQGKVLTFFIATSTLLLLVHDIYIFAFVCSINSIFARVVVNKHN